MHLDLRHEFNATPTSPETIPAIVSQKAASNVLYHIKIYKYYNEAVRQFFGVVQRWS